MRPLLAPAALGLALIPGLASAQNTVYLGETNRLGFLDAQRGNTLSADGPFLLDQAALLNSFSVWIDRDVTGKHTGRLPRQGVAPGGRSVPQLLQQQAPQSQPVPAAADELILGVYDAGPNHDCISGNLLGETDPFEPQPNTWNTVAPNSTVQLPAGVYCLAFLPNNNAISFRTGMTGGLVGKFYPFPFAALPEQFSGNPTDTGGLHWSLYATLTVQPPTPQPMISFDPPVPSVAANAPLGTSVSTISVTMTDGSAFSGVLSFGPPYNDDGGLFALSCQQCATANVIVNPSGAGLTGLGNTTQNVTVVATAQ